ncbi:hypothetical protein H6P81_012754 [Aristolochia fimbriata]|uniref:Uncharacterized protein n=1 Tax=Aristolochia fimbriata TaxID=158543 RepID=A0AAV7EFU6_ARIFI|nr:hypothetical protein H6P81_012754 [Aristolochia fimbriata]
MTTNNTGIYLKQPSIWLRLPTRHENRGYARSCTSLCPGRTAAMATTNAAITSAMAANSLTVSATPTMIVAAATTETEAYWAFTRKGNKQ